MTKPICVETYIFLSEIQRQNSNNYYRFMLSKGNKHRQITAPKDYLKEKQRWVLQWLYDVAPVHVTCHGFVPGRSILTNAQPHVAQDWVVNVDIKDFFPSTTREQVEDVFRTYLGKQILPVDSIVETLCNITLLQDRLPQGSPCSPYIANLVMHSFDEWASSLGINYTRYADDLTFSGMNNSHLTPDLVIDKVKTRLSTTPYRLADKKTSIRRKHRRQTVTGLVVNKKVTLPTEKKRALRAFLHHAKKDGLDAALCKRNSSMDELLGELSFSVMCDRKRMLPLLRQIMAL